MAVQRVTARVRGPLLCAMLVFSPWAFGTTQQWSVIVMNCAAYLLGVLTLTNIAARWTSGERSRSSKAVVAVGGLTLLVLAYSLTSAINAAAIYLPTEWRLDPRPHIAWLPHSYDAPSSWKMFWSLLALACAFWSTWDWLSESRHVSVPRQDVPRIPSRLRALLWTLTINGALLAIEAIIQRTSGTPNLLWLQPTHDNPSASAQLGPFAYRANGAQYLNLILPVALGFWWWLHHDRSQKITRRKQHHIVLSCVLLIAACALFSLSRGAVAVTVGLTAISSLLLVTRRASAAVRASVAAFAALVLLAGFLMSWKSLHQRIESSKNDVFSGRTEVYARAEHMARDYPWFGTGPGTFNFLFQLYRESPEHYWPAQLHNDWLEFRITFGRIGFSALIAALTLASLRWFGRGGVPRDPVFLALTTFALAGCLLHARFDFPFQIYSIAFLFVVLAAVLFSSSRHRA
jgi:O-antigen ligase